MYNKVFLIGRLVRDPEVRVTVSGITIARFTVAVDRFRKNEDGSSSADFLRVVCFRRLGEVAGQYLKKGKLVSVEGALRFDSYEKEGQTRESVEILADNFQMLDRLSQDPMESPMAAAEPTAQEAPF